MEVSEIPRTGLQSQRERELRRFAELRPRGTRWLERARSSMPNGVPMTWMSILHEHPPIVVESQSGGTFADIDGNTYADFNLADMSIPVATVSPQPAVGLSSAAAIVLLIP